VTQVPEFCLPDISCVLDARCPIDPHRPLKCYGPVNDDFWCCWREPFGVEKWGVDNPLADAQGLSTNAVGGIPVAGSAAALVLFVICIAYVNFFDDGQN
jgi:hypothetical protein